MLLDGPSTTIDHLTLEVTLDEPYLVDVGFGEGFITPLRLNAAGPQDGGDGTYEFIDSAHGRTLTRHEDGRPVAQYRFRRVNRLMTDFEAASHRLQSDPGLHWSNKPFATRLLDGGPDRVTLLGDRLRVARGGGVDEIAVAPEDWADRLEEWFGMRSGS